MSSWSEPVDFAAQLETDEVPQPGPSGDPPAPTTGHPAVDAALAELARVASMPPAEQVPAFQALHRTLRDTLAGIDED